LREMMIGLSQRTYLSGLLVFLGIGLSPILGALESCFEDLPPGWAIANAYEVDAVQTRAIGEKLGGRFCGVVSI